MAEDYDRPGYVEVAIPRDFLEDKDEIALSQTIRAVNRQQHGNGPRRPPPAVEVRLFSEVEMIILKYLLPQTSKTLIDLVAATGFSRGTISCCLKSLTDRGVLVCHTETIVGNFVGKRVRHIYTLVSHRVRSGSQEFDIAKDER